MSFCLPKEFASKFVAALKDGVIDPAKLIDMTSAERREFLGKIVGEDHAREVNALLESKILLKDQKRGMVSWAKKVAGITEETRRDLISKIERMDTVLRAKDEQAFLEDLAAKKLGTDVTFEEAKKITEGIDAVKKAKAAIDRQSPEGSESRVAYGLKAREFGKYVAALKLKNGTLSWKEWITKPSEVFYSLAGTTKSVLSSLDNSYFGRQGIKMLYTNPDIWAKSFLKSWGDIAKELKNTNIKGQARSEIDAIDMLMADILSRENALNGKYEAGGYDLGIASEEAFPSSLPEKIPYFGRLFKASESAFNGAALRMRSDYADRIIEKADAFGINTLDKAEAKGLGDLVNSMTGRGNIGRLSSIGKEINASIFSIKFLKSNFDTLLAHRFGYAIEEGATRDFVRKQSAANLLKITATVSAVLFTANQLWPGSVNFDPRSSDFGKIRIGKHTIDITGGMAGIVTLAARLTPTMHNGEWGFWFVNKKGVWTKLNDAKFGQQNAVDVLDNFWQGKLSPVAGTLRDVWKGHDFSGAELTPLSIAENLFVPLPIQTAQSLDEENAGAFLAFLLLESLGLSVGTDQKPR